MAVAGLPATNALQQLQQDLANLVAQRAEIDAIRAATDRLRAEVSAGRKVAGVGVGSVAILALVAFGLLALVGRLR